MLTGLALPVLILMAAAILVTRIVERIMPESMAGIAATFVASLILLWLLSALLFAALYAWQGVTLAAMFGPSQGWRHFLWLGAKSALVWGPVMALVVVTSPRRWKSATW